MSTQSKNRPKAALLEILAIHKPDSVVPARGFSARRKGDNLSGPLIARRFMRHSPPADFRYPTTDIASRYGQSTALHWVRILPFHFRFFVPIAELGRLRWDWASPSFRTDYGLTSEGVTDRTSMLSHGRRYLLPCPVSLARQEASVRTFLISGFHRKRYHLDC